ncbi:MAG TPA: hypothetical protein VMY98_03370, partial [Anaerolineae bacterium]|nr:hypothetical protein [Anaerolineae bacterium]
STLADRLEQRCSCHPVGIDQVYVDFVNEKHHTLSFQKLCDYIAPHYHHILGKSEWSLDEFGACACFNNGTHDHILGESEGSVEDFRRDFVKEWHCYLFLRIEDEAKERDKVVVEGYLLKDCEDVREKLQRIARVIRIQAADWRYTDDEDNAITEEEICALVDKAAQEP